MLCANTYIKYNRIYYEEIPCMEAMTEEVAMMALHAEQLADRVGGYP